MRDTNQPSPETPGMDWSELKTASSKPADTTPASRRRRWTIRITALIGAVVALVFIVPPTRLYVLGTLGMDPFFAGRPALWWAGQLRDRSDRDEAVERLSRGGERALPVLARLLEDSDVDVRAGAARAAAAVAPATDGAIPLLVKALGDTDTSVRSHAAEGIDRIAPRGGEAIPLLIALVQEQGRDSEYMPALSALAKFGPDAKAAVIPLLQMLPTNSRSTSIAIYKCLMAIDSVRVGKTVLLNDYSGTPQKLQFVGDTRDVICQRDGSLFLWRGGMWKQIMSKVKDFSVLPDGRSLIALIDGKKELLLIRWSLVNEDGQEFEWAVANDASHLSVSADGQLVVTASETGHSYAFDVATGRPVESVGLPHGRSSWLDLAFSPQGRDLASGIQVRTQLWEVSLVDTTTGDVRWEQEVNWIPSHVGLTGDGTVIAAFHLGSKIHVWDGQTRRETIIDTGCEQVCRFTTCKGGAVLAATTGEDACTVGLWNLKSGARVEELRWHRRHPGANVSVNAIALSRDGTRLASMDSDGWIRFWDLEERGVGR
jgi:hypothetical protein